MREKLKIVFSSTATIVVAAFLVRLAVLCYFAYQFQQHRMEPVRTDAPFSETGEIAAAVAEGRGFSSPLRFVETGPTAWLAPVYPYLLAGIFQLFGIYSDASNLISHTMNCAFSAFTVWPIAAVGTMLFGRKRALAAAWLWAILPNSIVYAVFWVWDTSLAALWMALLVAATLKLRGSDRMVGWIGYGALWAAGGLINPALLVVSPFLALWAIAPLRRQPGRAMKIGAVSGLVFFAVLAPWTIRNYSVFHKFIPLRSNFGLELWLGNSAGAPDGWAWPLHPNDNLAEAQKYARMTEIPYMEEKQREAIAFIRAHPAHTAYLVLHRFAQTWMGTWEASDPWLTATVYETLLIAATCLFSVMSLLGVLFAYREQRSGVAPLAMVLLVFPLVFYFTHTSLRYRFPMDPLMLILAVYAAGYLAARVTPHFTAIRHPVHAATPAAGPDFPQG